MDQIWVIGSFSSSKQSLEESLDDEPSWAAQVCTIILRDV